MKVKVLTRNPDDYLRETKRDIHKVPRNFDPDLHPFEGAREYVRAVNAVKLEKVYAKPFIGSLDGHREGITAVAKHPKSLSVVASGSYDGEVRFWDLPTRKCIRNIQAHDDSIKGMAYTKLGERFITIGDNTIKIWNTKTPDYGETDMPQFSIVSKALLTGLTYSPRYEKFATCGEVCQLWEETRNEPLRTFKWGADTVHHIAFNPIETYLIGACAADRSITFYDTREAGPVRRIVLALRTNQISWNPMEAFNYTVANEDYNLYTFDIRRMSSAVKVHKGHISAVISVDYSPTGLEFVSGSYDRTLRIFPADKINSREVYHTKRMQRISNVSWSLDNKYLLSTSDEMNIRLWKARASEKLGVLHPRERASMAYNEALKKKYQAFPEVRKIAHFRHVPKYIYNASQQIRMMRTKEKMKESNRRQHSKPGTVPFVSEARKHIVKEE